MMLLQWYLFGLKFQASCLRQTLATQKAALETINIDALDDLQDEMVEMMQDQEEVQEILSRDYSLSGFDDAELEQELDELDDEIVAEKLQEVPANPLPNKLSSLAPVNRENSELNAIMNN